LLLAEVVQTRAEMAQLVHKAAILQLQVLQLLSVEAVGVVTQLPLILITTLVVVLVVVHQTAGPGLQEHQDKVILVVMAPQMARTVVAVEAVKINQVLRRIMVLLMAEMVQTHIMLGRVLQVQVIVAILQAVVLVAEKMQAVVLVVLVAAETLIMAQVK
tara:strand:+ start:66 stop:542 length:477 start_codon:yes stop_codon:yes gene_type:complete